MTFNLFFIWGTLWVIGCLYTYYIWILPEFNLLRIKNNLLNKNGIDDTTKNFIKSEFKFMFLTMKLKLFLLSTLLSGFITLIQFYAVSGKEIKNIYDIIGLSIPLFIIYMLLSGIKEHDGTNNKIEDICDILLKLKMKILYIFLEKEKNTYISCIDKKIKHWYSLENNGDSIIFATFILRMGDKVFVDILNNVCQLDDHGERSTEAKKSILSEKPLEIMNFYINNDINSNLLTRIIVLFDEYFKLENCEPYKIMSFISHTEISCGKKTRSEIKNNISSIVNKDTRNKVHKKNKAINTSTFDSFFINSDSTDYAFTDKDA